MIATAWRISIVVVVIGFDVANGEVHDTPPAVLPATVLEATLCADGKIPEATSREIRAESAAVFRDAGITLRIDSTSDRGCDEIRRAQALVVRVETAAPRYDAFGPTPAVASIQFIDGRPGRTITLSIAAARHLMRQDPVVRSLLGRVSARVVEAWAGRMLGRALAHELGHFVLGTPRHTSVGLMRATHSVQAFVEPARGAFRLAPVEREALLSRLRESQRTEATVAGAARE